jgi:PIN domain nuclease of toxin-antitoxin system
MRLLLDAHTFLWFAWGDKQLSNQARTFIESTEHTKYVSMASVWEMAIKLNLGKLKLARPFEEFLIERVDGNGFEILPIERAHTLQLVSMPLHHRDPFDRMLVAQSLTEEMPILSVEGVFDTYGVQRIW